LPVSDKGNNHGLLIFAVTTQAQQEIEISRVEVQYAAPLQLYDPGNRGFFIGSGTLDSQLPFCMTWNGYAEVRKDVQQAFALTAQFPNRLQDQVIRVCVHARRRRFSIGGFVFQGRQRVTRKDIRTRLIAQPLLGFKVPPLCSITTPQPFLIESGGTAATLPGESGSLLVHTRNADGTVSSIRVELPSA
jgi:hypothetical protein